jgi:hypothetical protein
MVFAPIEHETMAHRLATHRVIDMDGDLADRVEALVARARKQRSRGEARKMLGLLREACAFAEDVAWLWTLYGARLAEHGRHDDARRALTHALWLRRKAGDAKRARSTQAVLDRLGLPAAA